MQITNHKHPPLILRLVEDNSALENLVIPNKFPKAPIVLDNDELYLQETLSADSYVFAQFLYMLYINIFMTEQTCFIYQCILSRVRYDLLYRLDKVSDTSLKNFISCYFDHNKLNTTNLTSLLIKFNITKTSQLGQLAIWLQVAYGNAPIAVDSVRLYRVKLINLIDYTESTLELSAIMAVNITRTMPSENDDPLARLINSIAINPATAENLLYTLAKLALPLDPIALTKQGVRSVGSGNRVGISFLNYLAMYLRQLQFGYDYSLSVHADSRRLLMSRLHQFCGVGGVCYNAQAVCFKGFLIKLLESVETATVIDNKATLISILNDLIYGSYQKSPMFKDQTSHALEAKATATEDEPNPKKTAFKDDKDTVTDDDTDNNTDDDTDPSTVDEPTDSTDDLDNSNQPPDKTNDNNIDRTSDVGQDSAAAIKNAFIPLALPTETIDDNLLRRLVLKYVSDMDKDPSPDITPENLDALKYWCESWLFIASIDQTKKLLSQLNIVGLVKEFVK